MMSRRMAGWLACGLIACFAGTSGAGSWVVDGVVQGMTGGGVAGSTGPVTAENVVYTNGGYANLATALDALFEAVPATNITVAHELGYVVAGLVDNTGKGAVTLDCFNSNYQLWHGTRGFAEAGSNEVTALLNGAVKENYRPSRFSMSGISSLGWAQYDLFIYGYRYSFASGWTGVTIRCWNSSNAEVTPQTCGGWNLTNATHRTQFIAGTNYVKFAGLYGDYFRVELPQGEFSGIQIVKSGSEANPEGIGVRWTGGGGLLASTNAVGAEVACGGWYNIDPNYVIYH